MSQAVLDAADATMSRLLRLAQKFNCFYLSGELLQRMQLASHLQLIANCIDCADIIIVSF